ncbi:MAG: DMT family transporter [Lachnospiraceae bacterium]|nr:DMT family transporter [Lachnospiraceae bacterium]
MRKTQVRNSILLLLTAVIWGVAFVAQSVGMDYVGAFTFNCVRSIIGGLVLIPCIIFLRNLKKKEQGEINPAAEMGKNTGRLTVTRAEMTGGVFCGIALFAASNFQQFGISYTTVGKAGFITALYVVIVPVLGLFFKKKVSLIVWVSVVLSVIGLYLLCMKESSFSLSFGDFLVLICAVLFSIHILVIDYFSPKGDGVIMSCIQFFVCGVLSGIMMFLFEEPRVTDIFAAWMPILYAGILSCGVAYTLQIVGQKDMNPTVASLILCLESVVSALAGWLILNQALNSRELMGCMLMFAAIVLAQLPMPGKKAE